MQGVTKPGDWTHLQATLVAPLCRARGLLGLHLVQSPQQDQPRLCSTLRSGWFHRQPQGTPDIVPHTQPTLGLAKQPKRHDPSSARTQACLALGEGCHPALSTLAGQEVRRALQSHLRIKRKQPERGQPRLPSIQRCAVVGERWDKEPRPSLSPALPAGPEQVPVSDSPARHSAKSCTADTPQATPVSSTMLAWRQLPPWVSPPARKREGDPWAQATGAGGTPHWHSWF